MALQGDLATFELADILQNLEMHARTGTLSIEGGGGVRKLHVQDGRQALFAAEDRPRLVDDLVRAGLVSERRVASARRRRWRTRKSLGQMLVAAKALTAEALSGFAEARLVEDLCDLLAADSSTFTFTFTEEKVPRGVFDPEERRLALALPVGPLLFEAARRADHRRLVRAIIPTDTAHYLAREPDEPPQVDGDGELAASLLARLDGTRSVREVLEAFPHRRFEALEVLAELVRLQEVRAARADDLLELARGAVGKDVERAWGLVADGLEVQPHHRGLLEEKAALAGARGDEKSAAEALKLIAHLKLEGGEREEALADLRRAAELDPADTAIWERSLGLAIQDGRTEDALRDGRRLVDLHRAPGLHGKAAEVLETLVELEPESWDLRRELARSRVDCGQLDEAVAGLEQHGKKLLSEERYPLARSVFEEVLAVLPSRRQAQRTIEQIDGEVFARRREIRRRILRRAFTVAITVPLAILLSLDAAARVARSRAEREISRLELIELRRYDEAIGILEDVRSRHPWSATAWLELPRRIESLRAKR